MTEPDTEIQRAAKNGARLARIFLYRNLAGHPVFRSIHPAGSDEGLELLDTFEPPERDAAFDSTLLPSAAPPPST